MGGFRCRLSALICLGKGKFGQMTPGWRGLEVRVTVHICGLSQALCSS